jgi:3-(3-hydroxy-phenyl)propionate hydroxylase
VVRDGASADELDAYDAARHPAGERALQHTRAQALLARNDDDGRALREVFSELITNRTTARSLARLIESA